MLKRKHIRAPRTFDPGPGHPRERLAYLNDAEMQMLRALTDGRSDPGPKGIPSFAVTSGTTSGTTMGGNKTSSNPSGGGPGGPFGPNSGPSKSTTTSGSKSSGVTGGGGKGSSGQNSAPKSPSGPNGPNSGSSTGKTAGGVSASSATSGLGGSKSPSATSAKAPSTPSSPMGGQGSSFSSSAAASAYNRGVTTRSTPTPASPMGGQNATFSSPSRAAEANARTASAIKGGQNPSGSQRTASAVTQSQKDAYTQFGQKMAAAPRQPEVPRSPGDAEQLARMARAENNLIRDPVTGKMSQLAAQGTMDVVRNRMENQNLDVQGIISQEGQFSPWSDGSYAATKPSAAETAMAEQVLRGVTPDYTATPTRPQGADFYHNETTVKGGYSKASAATKSRIDDRFTPTLSVADAVKPGVYGHAYGYDPTGQPAYQTRSVPMGAPKKGATNYGPGGTPLSGNLPTPSLPSGAMSPDPNWGRMGIDAPTEPATRSVGGRFGGLRPSFEGPAQKIGYDSPDYGNIISRTNSDYYSRMQNEDQYNASIDGMRPDGSFTMGKDENGFARGVSRGVDGVDAFDVVNPDMVNASGVSYASYDKNLAGKTFDPNDATANQRAMNQALIDTALRTGQPIGMFSGNDDRGANHIGNATDINRKDPTTGEYLGGVRAATTANTSAAVQEAYRQYANDVFDTIYSNPDVYNVGSNPRWGGNFQGVRKGGNVPGDLMHFDTTPQRGRAGGVSAEQQAFREAAMARAAQGLPQSGFTLASDSMPSPLSGVMNSYSPPSEPGIYNGLKALPGAISGLGQGIRNLSETISTPNPTFKGFAGSITSPNPLVSAGAKVIGGQVIGPMVKEAAASAISGLKNTFDPNNPRAQQADAERRNAGSSTTKKSGPTASGVRETQRGEQREGTKTASATKKGGRNPEQGKGGDSESNRQSVKKETPAERARRIGRKKIEDLTKPEPKAADWSSYTNVMTREQALRKLLGEEWYA